MDTPDSMPDADATPADAARRIKDSAASVVERAKDAAIEKLEQGGARVSNSAHTAASALRHAADEVAGDNPWIGSALRKSADGLERATQSLSGGDINRVLGDLNGFARSQPAVFLGASMAIGFALARVGKTAIEQAAESVDPTIARR